MKRLGFKPHFAGAVEAYASSGGTFTPPIMGAVVFIMCDFLGMPYREVMLAAAIPAFLYYLSGFFMVHFEAAKTGLKGIPKEEVPSVWGVLKAGWFWAVPVIVLIYILIVAMWSVQRAAFWAIVTLIAIEIIRQLIVEGRVDFKRLVGDIEHAVRSYLPIGAILFGIGLVIYSIDITGLALLITTALTELTGGVLFPLLVLAAVASLILGMGLPSTPCYVFLAVLAAPAVIAGGVPALAAHFFVLYFGILSHITPPVAITSALAAGIAGASFWKTAFTSMRIGIAGYILPFLFVYYPCLLLIESSPVEILWHTVTAATGLILLAAVVHGHFISKAGILLRILLTGGAAALFLPKLWMNLIGFGVAAVVAYWQLIGVRKMRLPKNSGGGI